MNRIIGYFLQGLLYLGPIALTIYIIIEAFNFIDGLLIDYIEYISGLKIPGLGLLIILILLTILGYLGQTILATPFKMVLRRIILRIPPINLIYSSLSDLFAAIVGKERKFTRPVLVKLHDQSSIERIGFITEEELEAYGMTDKAAVYFPFSYAITGELLIVPKANITPLNIPPSSALKFIVSGGITDIERKNSRGL